MVILKILLLPFAALYDLITGVRNKMYDLGLKPSVQFEVPVINIGNLSVGGTGKSPMVEHLIRLLSTDYKIATLSRGYGRKTKGIRIGSNVDNADTLGDEPYQFLRKFSPQVTVAVGEDRAFAIPGILQEIPDTQIILLDDAYQHRSVKPLFNILLTDFNRPFYQDYILPAGRLREARRGASRADVVVVTKCHDELTEDEMITIEHAIRQYVDKPVFFTKIRYGFPKAFGAPDQQLMKDKVILVSGIANPFSLEEYVKNNFELIDHINFRDHYHYRESDMHKLVNVLKKNPETSLLTTEKDMVKMNSSTFKVFTSQISAFYLPIEVEFLKDGENFDKMVQSVVKEGTRNEGRSTGSKE